MKNGDGVILFRSENWGGWKTLENVSPTLRCTDAAGVLLMNEKKIGNIYGFDGGNFAGNVYDQNYLAPTIRTMCGGNQQPLIKVPQATKQGFSYCEIGGVMDMSYPSSETRRGRVQENGTVSPTITTENEICRVESDVRIRKLTERECFRLMGVKDEDFDRVAKNQSKTSLYHLAGDSIVVDVLMAIFKEMEKKL